MKVSLLYRITSVLLLLFAAGHTLGFRMTDPKLGAGPVIASLQTLHFQVQGFSRTFWDFYVGFGLFVSLFLVFGAYLAWQLGGLQEQTLAILRGIRWGLAICFAAETVLTWKYFFIGPIVFSLVITVCLITAAWFSARPVRS
jgi:hypothetical protein